MAARSRSATRSAPAARASWRRWRTSCAGVAAATGSRRSASASDRDWRWSCMREPALDHPDYKATALRHPKEPLIKVGLERGGPALSHLRPGEISNDLTKAGPVGE